MSAIYNRLCTESKEHLAEKKMSYCAHLKQAVTLSFHSARASVALLVHGLVPAWCKTTGSNIILTMAEDLSEHPPQHSASHLD
jgi:hypothetical protein